MANVQISDKNRRELSRERDFPVVTSVARRYAILSSPRCGSTLLGRVLYATKLAGDPQEYFNPPLLALEREQTGNAGLNINAFMRAMQARRTSPNGVFGLKMHYSQLLNVFRVRKPNANLIAYLRKFDKLIWMRRRDRIRQAISQAVGLRTNVWSSEDSRFEREPDVTVHPYEVIRALNAVCHEDAGWEMVIKGAHLAVHEIWYEDLVADYEQQLRRVLRFLEIEQGIAAIPEQPIERQSGPLNERLRVDVLAYLGMPDHG